MNKHFLSCIFCVIVALLYVNSANAIETWPTETVQRWLEDYEKSFQPYSKPYVVAAGSGNATLAAGECIGSAAAVALTAIFDVFPITSVILSDGIGYLSNDRYAPGEYAPPLNDMYGSDDGRALGITADVAGGTLACLSEIVATPTWLIAGQMVSEETLKKIYPRAFHLCRSAFDSTGATLLGLFHESVGCRWHIAKAIIAIKVLKNK